MRKPYLFRRMYQPSTDLRDRWKLRSKFHKGIAEAMADQWGGLDLWIAADAA